MRKMTEEQATYFIKAGYYPTENDIEAIVDLQDVFGHLSYWFNFRLLADDETHDNALKLFKLIWNKDDVFFWERRVEEFKRKKEERDALLETFNKLNKEVEEVESKMYV